mmetsp:Transcript_34956/g.81855  ORF Transcript_34956/g.81855 Transcript_34956/m.81855 type:complete len:258 (-) Transcript_34956:653-1426(-)
MLSMPAPVPKSISAASAARAAAGSTRVVAAAAAGQPSLQTPTADAAPSTMSAASAPSGPPRFPAGCPRAAASAAGCAVGAVAGAAAGGHLADGYVSSRSSHHCAKVRSSSRVAALSVSCESSATKASPLAERPSQPSLATAAAAPAPTSCSRSVADASALSKRNVPLNNSTTCVEASFSSSACAEATKRAGRCAVESSSESEATLSKYSLSTSTGVSCEDSSASTDAPNAISLVAKNPSIFRWATTASEWTCLSTCS